MSPRQPSVPLVESQHHVINPTNPSGALDDSVEDRLHVGRRAADDAEHLGRCGLMLQGLAQFRVALLNSLNSRTFSMAITAWAAKVSSSLICFSEKGRTSVRRIMIAPIAIPSRSNGVARTVRMPRNSWAIPEIPSSGSLQDHECEVCRSIMARPGWSAGRLSNVPHPPATGIGPYAPQLEVLSPSTRSNQRIRRIAQPRGILRNDIQHRLNIRRRAGDDAQDFARRRLLLQRLLEFLKQPHVLDRDHRLVGEGFKQFDLRRGEGTHLGATCDQCSNEFALLTKGNEQKGARAADDTATLGNRSRARTSGM